jgi:hypothetical protein
LIRWRPRAASRPPRPAVQLLPLLLLVTRELLELPRGFFRFFRERPLGRAGSARAALSRLRHPALPLHFLLLPACQLLQFLDELIDLLVAALLFGALLHLVLVRELVQLELEQIRQVVGERALLAAATAAALLLRHLQFVFLLGVLKQLERALLRRQRRVSLHRLQIGLGGLHLLGGLGERLGDLVVRRIHRAQACLQLADQLFDLIAKLRLCEVEEHDVLAEFLRLGLRLVADDVERGRDDLALLLRKLAHLLSATASAASAARL